MSATNPMEASDSPVRVAAVSLGLVAVAQLALVAAAALRIIDPGWEAAGIVGVFAGLAMVLTVLTVMLPVRGLGPTRILTGLAGVAAGVVVITTWGTLLGSAFLTSDSIRIGFVVAADSVFALTLIELYLTMKGDRPYALRALAGLGSLRAALEVLVFVMLASIGTGGLFFGLVVGAVFTVGVVVLAVWELGLAWWAFGRSGAGMNS